MSRAPLSLDTPADVEARQVAAWRSMTPADKLGLVMRLSHSVRQLALAGVRRRFPDASPDEQRLRLAQLLFGDALARAAYPEIERLDRS
jgi:hypothetical protein